MSPTRFKNVLRAATLAVAGLLLLYGGISLFGRAGLAPLPTAVGSSRPAAG